MKVGEGKEGDFCFMSLFLFLRPKFKLYGYLSTTTLLVNYNFFRMGSRLVSLCRYVWGLVVLGSVVNSLLTCLCTYVLVGMLTRVDEVDVGILCIC